MKKVLALSAALLVPAIGFAGTDEAPEAVLYDVMPISAVVPATDEPVACTMEYAPVCSVSGVTHGNACSAGKDPVAYAGECDSYVDTAALAKWKKKSAKLDRQLGKYSEAQLVAAHDRAVKQIEMTKMSRIVREAQVERITVLPFVRNAIEKKLGW